MGAWGEGPFDNDNAADMIGGLTNHVRFVVEAKTDRTASRGYNECRAAIQLILLAHGTDILGGPDLQMCMNALIRIRQDEKNYIDTWRDPRTICKQLDKEIAQVKRAMKSKKRDAVVTRLIVEVTR
jgi:Domain of unknown function (DUF4259)